jgi:glycosyltransferase involved in cell wall biosynthesis
MLQIILSTYNGSQHIVEQLESIIRQQTEYEFEILIRDDGSTDDTCLLIEQTFDRFGFSNFILERGENIGYMKSFSYLLSKTTSEFILFSDQDDIWNFNKIQEFMNCFINLKKTREYIVLYSEMDVFGKLNISKFYNYNVINNNEIHFFETYIAGCSMGINAKVKDIYLELSESMNGICSHDTGNLMIGALTNGIHKIEQTLFYYRIHDTNLCGLSTNKDPLLIKLKILIKYILQNRKYREIIFDDYYLKLAENLKKINSSNLFIQKKNMKYLELILNFQNLRFLERKYKLLVFNFYPKKSPMDKIIRFLCI